ncbi:glutamate decarboxylase [Halteromyces radiatus]|uniref:glutamate decarboxylase n=1 Tax=Halteromyces radiatus TaxID=101107 RepID=UPI00221F7B29|nr:glutamate decarboxylase [Halteromyces radiatus]KAI8098516.1 glutamate decarboxylase [Halteromyces radiatus]
MVFLSNAVSEARIKETNSNGVHHADTVTTSVYGSRWAAEDIPRYQMPEDEMPSNTAYRLVRDELQLDGNPALNLATFVTTYMEDEAEKLMAENIAKNFIDHDEYASSAELCNRCVNMIARLYHAPMHDSTTEALGCSTVGSSEAIILSTLAMKRRWQLARKAKGLPTDNPNLILGSNQQVAWHKATRYLEVESREVDCSEGFLCLDPVKAVELADENTIGIVVILGSTYTGHYEDAKKVNELLEKKCAETGWDIGIHVDAASGGFVAPFVNPDLEWDFRLPRVVSINVSGHKYGLTYPGVGWNVWRSSEYLPKDLIFNINYLGSDQASFTLNFSKGAAHVIAQYYVLIRLGKAGFTKIMTNLTQTADHLSDCLRATGRFEILSEGNGNGLPLVAFSLKGDQHFDEFDLSAKLRERGWIVPAYTMAPKLEHKKLLRVVVREDFSRSRCEILIRDIVAAMKSLDLIDQKTIEAYRAIKDEHSHFALQKNIAQFKIKDDEPVQDANGEVHSLEIKQAPGIC